MFWRLIRGHTQKKRGLRPLDLHLSLSSDGLMVAIYIHTNRAKRSPSPSPSAPHNETSNLALAFGILLWKQKKSRQRLTFDVYLWKPIKVKCHWSEDLGTELGTGIWIYLYIYIYLCLPYRTCFPAKTKTGIRNVVCINLGLKNQLKQTVLTTAKQFLRGITLLMSL